MKVAVIGGGAAGLAAGVALKRAGVEVVLFEAEKSVGGKLRTVERDGFQCEDGPSSLTPQSVTAFRIARQHALEVASAAPPRTRYVVRAGRMRAMAPPRLAGVLSPGAWARLALEPLAVLRPGQRLKAQQDESLRELMVRHLGAQAGGLAANLLANGVYAGDPRRLSARDAFPRLSSLVEHSSSFFVGAVKRSLANRGQKARGDQPQSLWIPAKGMGALARALASELGSGVRLWTRVERLALATSGPGAFTLALADGQLQVDGVISALPPGEAARLLAPLAAGAEELKQIRSSPLVVVHLGYRIDDFARKPQGFGVLDGDGSLRLLGVLFPSSLFGGRAPEGHLLFTCLLGGLLHPEMLELDDAALAALCRTDLQKLFGVTRPAVFERVARWREAVPQPELGHRERLARVRGALAGLPPLELAGAAYDGVAVEQVLQGGEKAAERLLARLGVAPEV